MNIFLRIASIILSSGLLAELHGFEIVSGGDYGNLTVSDTITNDHRRAIISQAIVLNEGDLFQIIGSTNTGSILTRAEDPYGYDSNGPTVDAALHITIGDINFKTSNLSSGLVFAGPATITFGWSWPSGLDVYTGNNRPYYWWVYEGNPRDVYGILTYSLVRKSSPITVSNPITVPPTSVTDANWDIQLEVSEDLKNWSPTISGEYLGNSAMRFFRINAKQITE